MWVENFSREGVYLRLTHGKSCTRDYSSVSYCCLHPAAIMYPGEMAPCLPSYVEDIADCARRRGALWNRLKRAGFNPQLLFAEPGVAPSRCPDIHLWSCTSVLRIVTSNMPLEICYLLDFLAGRERNRFPGASQQSKNRDFPNVVPGRKTKGRHVPPRTWLIALLLSNRLPPLGSELHHHAHEPLGR